jgi:D-glycero-alpha-D-manno-heptose 1-phosphate guanylyltransferase
VSAQNFQGVTEAAVLVGGLGTRLRGVLADQPKALAFVGGKSILAHILDALAENGLNRVILCTGHLAEQIEAAFGLEYKTLKIVYSRENTPLGTAGALVQAANLFRNDRVLILNGDSFSPFSVAALAKLHEARKAVATILLAKVTDSSRYGAVDVDAAGAVLKWLEKGQPDSSEPKWINAGVYLINTGLIRSLRSSKIQSLERELFPSLIGNGLFALRNPAPFLDIGTPESLAAADAFFRVIGSGAVKCE